jgi:hypothetical protein
VLGEVYSWIVTQSCSDYNAKAASSATITTHAAPLQSSTSALLALCVCLVVCAVWPRAPQPGGVQRAGAADVRQQAGPTGGASVEPATARAEAAQVGNPQKHGSMYSTATAGKHLSQLSTIWCCWPATANHGCCACCCLQVCCGRAGAPLCGRDAQDDPQQDIQHGEPLQGGTIEMLACFWLPPAALFHNSCC